MTPTRIKAIVKAFLERRGWYLRKTAGIGIGNDLYVDLSRIDCGPIKVVFDVGAHWGETAVPYAAHFPGAKIYAFEPIRKSFTELEKAVRHCPSVTCIPAALGDREGEMEIELQANTTTNTLKKPVDSRRSGGPSEKVTVLTIDGFMMANGIEEISLLKIDTEGYEIQVLRGASKAFSERRIKCVFVETTLNQFNLEHTTLREIQDVLAEYNFVFVAMYDQSWTSDKPKQSYYFNVLFARADDPDA